MPYTNYRGGKGFFEPVIERPDPKDTRLSFHNLCEAFALRALRETHDIQLKKVREAIQVAQRRHGISRLLISPQLKIAGPDLLLDTYFELEHLTPSAQLAARDLMAFYLKRIELENWLESELCPIPKMPQHKDERLISVSPFIAFGRPRIKRRGISTGEIAQRFDVGEPRETIIADYQLTDAEFTEAIVYESRTDKAA
jgi:uncharacterized protein (DUF433 family)